MIAHRTIFFALVMAGTLGIGTANAQGFFRKPPEAAPAPSPMPVKPTTTEIAKPAPPMPSPNHTPTPAVGSPMPAPFPAANAPTVKSSANAGKAVTVTTPRPVSGRDPARTPSQPKPERVSTPRPATLATTPEPVLPTVVAAPAAPGPNEVCGRFNVLAKALCVARECLVRPGHPTCMALAKEAEERRAQQDQFGGR